MDINIHTAGPWNFKQPGHEGVISGIVRDRYNRFVASCNTPDTGEFIRDYDEMEANARLIATAPELLEALEACEKILYMYKSEIMKLGHNVNDEYSKVKQAIKHAKG